MNKIEIAVVAFITFLMLAAGFASIPTSSAESGSVVPFTASGDNLTIYANGTVSNSSLVSISGNVYTLTQSINGSLYVNDSGITVSGNGFSVNGYNGIALYRVSDVKITDFGAETGFNNTYFTANMTDHITLSDSNVSLASGNPAWLNLFLPGSVTFTGNHFSNANAEFVYAGNVSVSRNTFNGGLFAVDRSANVTISQNSFVGNLTSFYVNVSSTVEYTNNNGVNLSSQGIPFALNVENVTSVSITDVNISMSGIVSYESSLILHNVSSVNIYNATFVGLSGMDVEWVNSIVMHGLNSYGMTSYGGVAIYETGSVSITASNLANYGSYYYGSAALGLWWVTTVVIKNSTFYGGEAVVLSGISNLFMNQTNVTGWGVEAFYTYDISSGTVMNSNFSGDGEYVVYMDEYTNITFTQNVVFPDYNYAAMYIYWSSSRITDNVFSSYYGSDIGIYLYYTQNIVITGNKIGNSFSAINTVGDVGTVISGNNLSDSEYMLDMWFPTSDVVSGNTIHYTYTAMYLSNGTNVVFSGNNVSATEYGVMQFFGSGNAITANTFTTNSGYGFGFTSYQSVSYNLAGNTFTGFNRGINSSGDSGATWINNEFQGGNFGVVLTNSSYLTAAGNTFAYYNTSIIMAGVIAYTAFYHNNFIGYNQALNTTNVTAIYKVSFNGGNTVGGNYWTGYSGSFSNGLGNSPYMLGSGLSDNYPLQYLWKDPVITFVSTGLMYNTQWSVTVGGNVYTTSSASINVPVTRGSYGSIYYSVGNLTGYSRTAESGTVYYSGSSVTAFVNFVQLKYAVAFNTQGLPGGTSISLEIGNNTYSISGSGSVSLPNGTYTYSVSVPAGYTTSKQTGTFTVSGASIAVSIPFWTAGITVTFSEAGLSSGSSWSVTVNGSTYNGTGTTIAVTGLQAGTYAFTVSGPSGYIYSSSGNVSLAANATVLVNFVASSTITSSGVGAGTLAAVIVGSIAAGFVAMLLVALFAPAFVDSLRKKISGGNKGGDKTEGKQEDSSRESTEETEKKE